MLSFCRTIVRYYPVWFSFCAFFYLNSQVNGSALPSSIIVEGAWARAMSNTSGSSAIYLSVKNAGSEVDRIVDVQVDFASSAYIHRTKVLDGVVSMLLVDYVDIPPKSRVEFLPGQLHVMILGLDRPLGAGDSFSLDLVFAKAGTIPVIVGVRPLGYTGH